MTPEQALQTIEQALNIAVQKGAYQMADVQVIINALTVIKGGNEAGSPSVPAKG